MPMLQLTTASAVIAVSQSFTSVTRCPAGRDDHSLTKARVFDKICGANAFTLIWLKPRGRRLCPVCQSSLVSLLVNRPLPVKSWRFFWAGRFQSFGNSALLSMSSWARRASAENTE